MRKFEIRSWISALLSDRLSNSFSQRFISASYSFFCWLRTFISKVDLLSIMPEILLLITTLSLPFSLIIRAIVDLALALISSNLYVSSFSATLSAPISTAISSSVNSPAILKRISLICCLPFADVSAVKALGFEKIMKFSTSSPLSSKSAIKSLLLFAISFI